MEQRDAGDGGGETRAGHIALVGRPNVGKSTLLNAFLGEKLSIVTSRAQTTREAVTGILTTDAAQAIFVDTPGLLEPQYALQQSMLHAALATLSSADLVLLLLDATQPGELPDAGVIAILRARIGDVFVAINKVDAAKADAVSELTAWSRRELEREPVRVSAVVGDGVMQLREALVSALPLNPFFYPEDEIATQPVRFFVEEFVRETIFEEYEQEIPYATVVRIEEFREAADPIYIRATIYVERESQKGIIIGQRGAGIKRVGERARSKIESFVGAPVYLDLWVKALPGWRRKASALKYLGYAVPTPREVASDARRAGTSTQHGASAPASNG